MSNNHVLVKNRKKKRYSSACFPPLFPPFDYNNAKKKTLKSDWNTVLHASA